MLFAIQITLAMCISVSINNRTIETLCTCICIYRICIENVCIEYVSTYLYMMLHV